MLRIVCAILAIVAMSAAPAFAQCNSANGQCGAPSVSSLSQQAQLLQAQLNNGVASSSASAATSAPAATFAAPAQQFVYSQQYAAPAFAYGAYAGAVHPSQIVIAMPAMAPMAVSQAPAPAAESVAVAPVQQVAPLYQFATFQAPVAATAGGASAAASASAGGIAPVQVNPGLASASVGGCASGNCSARAGIGSRLGARLRRPRSTAASFSFSRTRGR